MARQSELFPQRPGRPAAAHAPLADRLRPGSLDEFHGHTALLGPDGSLRKMLENGRLQSLVLWGPPGCGKTTLARLIAERHSGPVVHFSAVLDGVRELRSVVTAARRAIEHGDGATLLVVDEIHRFNKAQQDAFLPHVEDGTLIVVGMTTENPGFELVAPLLSRLRVVALSPLDDAAIDAVIERALTHPQHGLAIRLADDARAALIAMARGDARIALGALEAAASLGHTGSAPIDAATLADAVQRRPLPHDKNGDRHYDLLSAFIKAMRGTDPDAAVYYLVRLLAAGEDPSLIARRMIVFAAEDVGLAAPEALTYAVAACDALHVVGLPEARIPLAAAAIHLACAPKSNAAYAALQAATAVVDRTGTLEVPLHLRNAPTAFARAQGHGVGYRNPHHESDAGPRHSYLPAALRGQTFYTPTGVGWEGERLPALEEARARRRG